MNIHSYIEEMKGVGPKTKEMLNSCGIYTASDLLLYFPRDYEQIGNYTKISEAKENEKIMIEVEVVKFENEIFTKNKKRITTFLLTDGNSIFKGKWFNQVYIKSNLRPSKKYLLVGKIEVFRGEKILMNASIVSTPPKGENKIVSKYPLKGSLTHTIFHKLIFQIASTISISENLPMEIIEKYNFISLDRAIRNIHFPMSLSEINEAKRRLKFQELYTYSLKILLLKEHMHKNNEGIAFSISPKLVELKENLPFQLTAAQSKAVREILLDQKKNSAMNRLVQGDVGSGKTMVAIISLFNVVMNGFQVAFMAPTEILANQHFIETSKVLKDFNLNIQLLSGSVSAKGKQRIKEDLKNGKVHILIGTHALLQEDVEFNNLGMVITDEQHRFGVAQRTTLSNKGRQVDVLVMTATPIPRTLALYLYGDLNVSIINELPPGRQKIETSYVNQDYKKDAYLLALQQITEGRQVYVVCPLVEENEELDLKSVTELFTELKEKYFSKYSIAMLHGKMNAKEKDEIMSAFKAGEIHILISTTVIEVGVNVPNATVMIIENAERFGLAQLHQLRGRIGRGVHKSYCVLIADIKNKKIEKRMDIMKNSNDGFFIAEEDLKIRGSGELFGVKQHGEIGLRLADVVEDIDLFRTAHEEAKKLMAQDSEESIRIRKEILEKLEVNSSYICFN